ncbi:hypothetical protein TIFTF001_024663 [Ficus carica]|uniref:Uncharacterized protein n=1 Tax=Ficus carica TaxID=3494 RepID=A0AA88AMV4_FICCA|nr:hypothetical protein TIFTF001_024663 [Ficus carica]
MWATRMSICHGSTNSEFVQGKDTHLSVTHEKARPEGRIYEDNAGQESRAIKKTERPSCAMIFTEARGPHQ